ncbi:MAG: hypothetical protein WDZ68_01540 [Candidatus Paceibacterota bacterium]
MAKKTTSKKSSNNNHTSQNISIGVGITAAAAAAAGAYFLYGSKNAKQNRAKVKGWTLKAKGEVLEAIEKAEHMTKKDYEQLIDRIAAGYSIVKDASKVDIADFKREMKQHWENIEKSTGTAKKKVAKKATSSKKKS